MKFVITGGHSRGYGEEFAEWNAYDEAIIAILDTTTRKVTKVASYITPPELCSDDNPSIVFKAAHLSADTFFVCTMTEILGYDISNFEQKTHLTHRMFNDLHHVCLSKQGTFLVANTGLDMVVELDKNGKKLNEWGVLGGAPWQRFDKNRDYRKIATTKPHQSHPNFIFIYKDEIWVTRFVQKDAICLNKRSKRIDINIGNPHDGCMHADNVYFTTTNGYVVVANLKDFTAQKIYDLNKLEPENIDLGWCRGISIIDGRFALVGFSEFRQTKIKKNIEWIKSKIMNRASWGQKQTRVVMYDLEKNQIEWEVNLETSDINAVFSITKLCR